MTMAILLKENIYMGLLTYSSEFSYIVAMEGNKVICRYIWYWR